MIDINQIDYEWLINKIKKFQEKDNETLIYAHVLHLLKLKKYHADPVDNHNLITEIVDIIYKLDPKIMKKDLKAIRIQEKEMKFMFSSDVYRHGH